MSPTLVGMAKKWSKGGGNLPSWIFGANP